MKVKCIKKGYYTWLENGKEYGVIDEFYNQYTIKDDSGYINHYDKHLFETIPETEEEKKLTEQITELEKAITDIKNQLADLIKARNSLYSTVTYKKK